ncbi:hypothetical protein F4678DRAFT_482972 [Xylaria arbuscula]|nr:hypothetical protein F4678DRAFT_482972 [Xylaria arbuscula]
MDGLYADTFSTLPLGDDLHDNSLPFQSTPDSCCTSRNKPTSCSRSEEDKPTCCQSSQILEILHNPLENENKSSGTNTSALELAARSTPSSPSSSSKEDECCCTPVWQKNSTTFTPLHSSNEIEEEEFVEGRSVAVDEPRCCCHSSCPCDRDTGNPSKETCLCNREGFDLESRCPCCCCEDSYPFPPLPDLGNSDDEDEEDNIYNEPGQIVIPAAVIAGVASVVEGVRWVYNRSVNVIGRYINWQRFRPRTNPWRFPRGETGSSGHWYDEKGIVELQQVQANTRNQTDGLGSDLEMGNWEDCLV